MNHEKINQTKIKQTIQALTICSMNDPDGKEVPACPICPYYGIHNECCNCLMRDAAELMEKMSVELSKDEKK